MIRLRHLPLIPLLLTLAAGNALAHNGRGGDHDRARQALEAGEVLPLRKILEQVERDYPGQVMEVELERDKDSGRWIYEIRLLRSGGALTRLKVDAADGRVLGIRERERPGEPR